MFAYSLISTLIEKTLALETHPTIETHELRLF
jgi:hypothetical protein